MSAKPNFLQALRLPEVEKRVGLKRSRIYELEKAGKFPARIRLSERASAWYAHEIDEWLAARQPASLSTAA